MSAKKKESKKFKNPNFLLSVFKWWFSNPLVAKIVALISLINLGVILFDVTYIPLRDFWMHGEVILGKFKVGPYEYEGKKVKVLPENVSEAITNYDVIKGIVPYRDTQNYLEELDRLYQSIDNNGLYSNETRDVLENLRESSANMINENPFELANKTGTLEKIKNKMRDYIPNETNSSKQAFRDFFSVSYLSSNTEEKLEFFETEIRPLIETNYFRPYSETGGFVDYFGLIDFPFFVILAIDFIGRSLYISFRYTGVNFFDATLWRWYDFIFFLPKFRWLRIIPVTIRLDETKLLDFKTVKKQSSQGFVASIAEDITEVVVLRLINQIQNFIDEGEMRKLISPENNTQEYIDINNTDEIGEITKLFIQLTVYEALPAVKPEMEALFEYTIEKTIVESSAYQKIKNLPAMKTFPQKIGHNLSGQLYQIIVDAIAGLLKKDPVFDSYLQKIIDKFTKTITSEIGGKQSVEKIEYLLTDLLEEVKINYVQKLSQEDINNILEERRKLQQASSNY